MTGIVNDFAAIAAALKRIQGKVGVSAGEACCRNGCLGSIVFGTAISGCGCEYCKTTIICSACGWMREKKAE